MFVTWRYQIIHHPLVLELLASPECELGDYAEMLCPNPGNFRFLRDVTPCFLFVSLVSEDGREIGFAILTTVD